MSEAAGPVVVLASAGTGKTHALVERWVRAALGEGLADHVAAPRPEALAAITFTDKAGAELRARIEQRLARLRFAPESEPELRALARGRGVDDATLDEIRRAVARAPIGTFHSLCARLLREHAVAAGVDVAFRLLEPDEEHRLLMEIAEGVVLDALAANDESAADLVARFPLRGMFEGNGLCENLVAIWGALAERGLDASLLPIVAPGDVDAALARLGEVVEGAVAFAKQSTSKACKESTLPRVKRVRRTLEALRAARGRSVSAMIEAHLTLADDVKGNWGGSSFTEHRRGLVDAVAGLGAALVDEDTAPLAPAVRELVIELDLRQRREKDLRGVLGFGDVLVRARDLLALDASVRARAAARLERVLVDEYQDTSPVQEQIVALLTTSIDAMRRGPIESATFAKGPLSHAAPTPGKLCVVGDPKQSIYGFRGADAQVFARAIAAAGNHVTPLTVSRRSSAAVCALVNRVVASALPSHGSEVLTPLEPTPTLSPVGAWWTADGPLKERPIATIEREALVVADRLVADVLTTRRPSEVLVLVRRSRSAGVVGRALAARGVPVRVVGGDGFWRRPEVTDVVSALTLVTDPHNELAALTVLRSPLVGIPDDDILALFEALPTRGTTSWPAIVLASDDDLVSAAAKDRVRAFDALLHAARAHLATRPLVAILDDLIEGSAYDVACAAEPDAAQRLRHLEKLRAICGGKGDQGVLAIARLTDSVDDPPPEPVAFDAAIDEDAVRVMTIHQSKGLEADVVVLCDATVALRGNTDDVVFAPDVGLAVSPRRRPIARCAPAASASAGTCVQRARRALRARDEAELARLLYVAVTRARHAVYVVGEVKRAGSSSMLGLLAAARDADAGAFDALLPRVVVDAVSSRRYAAAKRPVPEASPPRAEQSAARTPVARLRASALLAAATPQLAIGLVGPGFEIHDDDVIPPRARGRLAHAIIGLIATADVDAILEDATAAAAIGAAERAIGAPPGAVDEGLRARVLTTLTGPLRALRLAGCTFESEVPTVLALDTAVVEGTADLVAHGKDGVTVIELKLSVAAARSEAALVQVLACCAGLEQRGAATRGGREVSVRAATWAIGERDPPASVLWGKVTKRHLASVLARVVST